MSARIRDELNIEAKTSAYALIDPTASWSDVLAFLNSWLAALDACTDGVIIAGTITALPDLPGGLKSAAVAGSRVEQNGNLSFMATGSTHRWTEIIPALSNGPTVISAGRPVLTGGDPLQELVGVLLGGTGPLEWTNGNDQPLASFKDALVSFWQHNRQLSVATYET